MPKYENFSIVNKILSKENLIRLHRRLKHYENIESKVDQNESEIIAWIENKSDKMPTLFEDNSPTDPIWQAAQRLLIEQALRPAQVNNFWT